METLSLPTIKNYGFETTDGSLQNNLLRQKVAQWIKFCLQTRHDPPLSKPLTIHLNALLDAEIAPENVVDVSFRTFKVLTGQLAKMGISETIMPLLVIPLGLSETLITEPVDAEALVQQINYNQPPSLYLIERSMKTILNAFEHYIFPLRTSDFLEDTGEFYVYYSTSRSLEDIENDWEYGRYITAEYYPSAYQDKP